MVYEIYYTPPTGKSPILKYGISDMKRNDINRPESQVKRLRSRYGASVDWKIKMFAPTNAAARASELGYVGKHIFIWDARPLEQFRP